MNQKFSIAAMNIGRTWRTPGAIAIVLAIQGCAIPGFSDVGQRYADQEKNQHTLGYRPVIETGPVDDQVPPEGALYRISPTLIKEQIANQPRVIPPEIRALFGKPTAYTLGPGDVIGVIVYDHPELLPNAGAVISQQSDPAGVSVAPGFILGATGEISFPYIGRVKLEGLTEIEASDLIAQKIAKYIRDPQVTVRIQSFRSRRAYVEGEIRIPGLQIFTDVPMTLAEAISRAGGITASGDRSFVTLTRGEKTVRLNLQLLQDFGMDASGILLRTGDVINVRNREESKVYVMGEVLRPSALLMRNGRLSLNEALGEAGGPNLLTSNPGQIYVIRNNSIGSTVVFNLDAKDPTALALADQFALQPRDVVYIDPVPLVRWARIVNLIVPAAQVVDYGSNAVK